MGPVWGAREPSGGYVFKKVCLFSGNANPALAAAIGQYLETPLGKMQDHALQRRRELRRDRRERPRGRRLRHPADLPPGERQRDGAAHHARRAAPRLGRVDHRRHPVLRLRAAGPQGRPAHAHHVQARGRPHQSRRRQPRRLGRPARRADPGVLQHPLRPPLRDAGLPRGLPQEELRLVRRLRLAGRRRRRARAGLLEAPRREPRHHRQAPRARERAAR